MGNGDVLATEILRGAADALGGPKELAGFLGIAQPDLQALVEGTRRPSFGIAVRALGLASLGVSPIAAAQQGVKRKPGDPQEAGQLTGR
jgi:hypothetical protein